MSNKTDPVGELAPGDPHPAAHEALRWIQSIPANTLMQFVEAYSSCAISGENKLAEVCAETLRRLLNHEAVSDRYLLGLAWSMRHIGDLSSRFRGMDDAPAGR